jgi:ribonucleotide reductase alpha subunit
MSNPLSELGEKIFLDRYSLKDMKKETLAVGDTVLVCVNQKTRQREIGTVQSMSDRLSPVVVKLKDGEDITVLWDDIDKPLELKAEDTMARTAKGLAAIEASAEKQEEWEEKFKWLLDDWRFVPGGRILAAAGTDQKLTYFNCYVIPSPKDSRQGIIHTLLEMTEIMSRGGGVGINLSTLRPQHAYVKGVNGRSSGSVSWGGLYSFATGLIEQGGSRRGALMLILNDWHPDILDFINAKREAGKITNANISVGVSDALMEAIDNDGDWNLEFPDASHNAYEAEWNGDIKHWKKLGYPVNVYKTIKARELWSKLIESAWASAEPGVFFIDRANNLSNSHYYNRLVATNPCLTGDTKVAVADGRGSVAIKQLAKEGKDVDVYCVNRSGTIVTRRMRNPRITGYQSKVFKITLDGGFSFRTTSNHKMITRDGTAVEVSKLKSGDELWFSNDLTAEHNDYIHKHEQDELKDAIRQGYIAHRHENGTVVVKKHCEVCGEDFLVPFRGREISYCSIECSYAQDKHIEIESGKFIQVLAIEEAGLDTVYNGTVDEYHNFCVCVDDANDKLSVVASRQCGEQPLPPYSVCLLGAINLSRFVVDNKIDVKNLEKAVSYAVRFMDNVIEATPYFLEENEKQQKGERRIGLGIMGLAEMLVRLKVAYGSKQGNATIEKIGKIMAEAAYNASADLAKEKGAFTFYKPEFLESGFMKQFSDSIRSKIEKHGIRNVTLLTVAPTGTTGTMVGTSTGIEPYYAWSYFRTSRLGVHEETVPVAKEWLEANPGLELPDYFVTAMDLTPEEHVGAQAAMQKWVDSAISKTCNAPNDYTVEQTAALYESLYKLGCKGGTIYRDGCRDTQVLSLKKEELKEETAKEEKKPLKVQKLQKMRTRPKMTTGFTHEKNSPLGTVFTTLNMDENGSPFELFINAGKTGSDVSAMTEALGRAVSLLLRLESAASPEERLSMIVDQFEGIGGSNAVGFGKNKIKSLPEAVAKSVEEILATCMLHKNKPTTSIAELAASMAEADAKDHDNQVTKPKGVKATRKQKPDLCPKCGEATFIREEGCQHCTNCDHSLCG